jgi:hypothetical protein
LRWCVATLRTLKNYRSLVYLVARTGDKFMVALIFMTLFANKGRKDDVKSIQDTAGLLFIWPTLGSFGASTFMCYLVTERALFYREVDDGLYSVFTYLVYKVRLLWDAGRTDIHVSKKWLDAARRKCTNGCIIH